MQSVINLYRSLFCCICVLGLLIVARPLAPPEYVTPPAPERWYWEGGEQLNLDEFSEIISEVLEVMPIVPYSETLVSLLIETAATESSLGYAVRDRSGKTLGVYQILHTTADYLLNKLRSKPEIMAIIDGYRDPTLSLRENLMHNLHFQTAVAIAYYWLRTGNELLDRSLSISKRAKLYKQKWNTPAGAATEAKYIRDSKRYLVSEHRL